MVYFLLKPLTNNGSEKTRKPVDWNPQLQFQENAI